MHVNKNPFVIFMWYDTKALSMIKTDKVWLESQCLHIIKSGFSLTDKVDTLFQCSGAQQTELECPDNLMYTRHYLILLSGCK